MKRRRFYCRPITSGVVELSGPEAKHLKSVLRLGPGEQVELFDGIGGWAQAQVAGIERGKVILQVEKVETCEPRSRGRIVIAAAIAKADRFAWLIGKCTELGVDRIMPVLFERAVKQAGKDATQQRWQRVAISAVKQCGRMFLPTIDKPEPLNKVLEIVSYDYPEGIILAGDLDLQTESLVDISFGDQDVIAFIGPEGGITPEERNQLEQIKAVSVRLTKTVLRVETAAVALAAILAAKRDA